MCAKITEISGSHFLLNVFEMCVFAGKMLKGEENEKQQGAGEAASTGESGGSVGGKKTAWVAPLKAEAERPEKERASQDGDKELDSLCDALDKVEARTGDDEAVEKPFSVVDDIEKEEYEREEKGRKEQTKETKGGKGGKAGKKSTTYSLYSSPTKHPQQQQQQSEPKMTTKKDFKVPREWASYSKCGEVVPTTPFLPFKTPLSEERFARHPELEEHSIITLIQDLSARGIRLRTVIDLTLPFFYETEFLEAFDIKYEKIRIDNQEPRWHQVKRFLEICDEFADEQFKRKQEWDERQRERKEQGLEEEYYMYEVLGVHCTRGVNRTGYMICRAMIERMNYTAEHAVKLFNQARGHEMTEFFPELKRAEEKKRSFDRRGAGRGRGGGEAYRGGRGGANGEEGVRGGGNEGGGRGEEGRGGGEGGGYRGARGGGSGGSEGGYRGGRGGGAEGYRGDGGSEGGYRGGRGGGYSGGEGGYRGGRGASRGRGQ